MNYELSYLCVVSCDMFHVHAVDMHTVKKLIF